MPSANEQLEEIWAAARQAAVAGRCGVDPEAPRSEPEYGAGITMAVPIDDAARSALAGIIEELRRFDGRQYWYPPATLHVTLHSVRWLEPGPLPTDTEFTRIANALRPVFPGLRLPSLELRGVVLFPGTERQIGAVAVQGFMNDELALLRDRIRQTAMDIGYPDRRNYAFGRGRYLTCAIARLRKQPTGKLIEAIGRMRERPIATVRPPELRLVTNGYFFLPETVVERARFPLAA